MRALYLGTRGDTLGANYIRPIVIVFYDLHDMSVHCRVSSTTHVFAAAAAAAAQPSDVEDLTGEVSPRKRILDDAEDTDEPTPGPRRPDNAEAGMCGTCHCRQMIANPLEAAVTQPAASSLPTSAPAALIKVIVMTTKEGRTLTCSDSCTTSLIR